MAYATFGGKWSVAAGDALNEDTNFNTPGDGIQDEFEERWGYVLDGVTSGMTCTTSGTTVAIASGDAVVAGKRYSGNTSVDLTGEAAADYYIIIDSSDDTTPYKAQTGAPTSGELTLCTCTWGGSAFSSPYIDDQRKIQGIQRVEFPFTFDGVLATHKRALIPVHADLWIEEFHFLCVENGSVSGGVTLDLLLGADGSEGTTIFTTTARRPSLTTATADFTIASMDPPDGDRRPDAGEHLVVAVDAIDGGGTASTCSGVVVCRYR